MCACPNKLGILSPHECGLQAVLILIALGYMRGLKKGRSHGLSWFEVERSVFVSLATMHDVICY